MSIFSWHNTLQYFSSVFHGRNKVNRFTFLVELSYRYEYEIWDRRKVMPLLLRLSRKCFSFPWETLRSLTQLLCSSEKLKSSASERNVSQRSAKHLRENAKALPNNHRANNIHTIQCHVRKLGNVLNMNLFNIVH